MLEFYIVCWEDDGIDCCTYEIMTVCWIGRISLHPRRREVTVKRTSDQKFCETCVWWHHHAVSESHTRCRTIYFRGWVLPRKAWFLLKGAGGRSVRRLENHSTSRPEGMRADQKSGSDEKPVGRKVDEPPFWSTQSMAPAQNCFGSIKRSSNSSSARANRPRA